MLPRSFFRNEELIPQLLGVLTMIALCFKPPSKITLAEKKSPFAQGSTMDWYHGHFVASWDSSEKP